ncbi:hypothetical protein MNBD_CHLOROFLEXI01-5255, partial [hydrothermal vent metagenome]
WSLYDHQLLQVVEMHIFNNPAALLRLLPPKLPQPFTNKLLAKAAKVRLNLAQRITYTLVRCGIVERIGKEGRANLYQFAAGDG